MARARKINALEGDTCARDNISFFFLFLGYLTHLHIYLYVVGSSFDFHLRGIRPNSLSSMKFWRTFAKFRSSLRVVVQDKSVGGILFIVSVFLSLIVVQFGIRGEKRERVVSRSCPDEYNTHLANRTEHLILLDRDII